MCGFLATNYNEKEMDINIHPINKMFYRGIWDSRYSLIGKERKGFSVLSHTCLPFVNLNPKTAKQPIKDSKGNIGVFVGEIFNWEKINPKVSTDGQLIFETVKEELRKNPSNPSLSSLHEFDGFWSYATVHEKSLFVLTDYLGQKPVYYRTDIEAFASEINVLCFLDDRSVTPDKIYQSNVLKWGYDCTGRTPWNEIKQLPPGSYYHKGKIKEYWDWDKVKTPPSLKDSLIKSISNRLLGKRSICLLLSGGLDSSIIYGIISKELKMENLITGIHIENNEKEYVDLLKVKNLLEIKSLESISRDEMLWIHQSPIDLGSVGPQIAMAKEIKLMGFQCVMTGDGADELFGGYNRAKEYDSQFSDIFMELPYYHLPRLDRINMRFTIEPRSPFLAPEIVKYALGLPYSRRNGIKKELMEEFGEYIPTEILKRKKLPLKTNNIRNDPMKERMENNNLWNIMVKKGYPNNE